VHFIKKIPTVSKFSEFFLADGLILLGLFFLKISSSDICSTTVVGFDISCRTTLFSSACWERKICRCSWPAKIPAACAQIFLARTSFFLISTPLNRSGFLSLNARSLLPHLRASSALSPAWSSPLSPAGRSLGPCAQNSSVPVVLAGYATLLGSNSASVLLGSCCTAVSPSSSPWRCPFLCSSAAVVSDVDPSLVSLASLQPQLHPRR
jgi:hypothetical protein